MLSYSHNNYIFVHLKLQYLKYKSVIKLKLCIKNIYNIHCTMR